MPRLQPPDLFTLTTRERHRAMAIIVGGSALVECIWPGVYSAIVISSQSLVSVAWLLEDGV